MGQGPQTSSVKCGGARPERWEFRSRSHQDRNFLSFPQRRESMAPKSHAAFARAGFVGTTTRMGFHHIGGAASPSGSRTKREYRPNTSPWKILMLRGDASALSDYASRRVVLVDRNAQ